MSKKKVTPPNATARLESPLHKKNHEELVTLTRQQVSSIQQSIGYPAEPIVQGAATMLLTVTDSYEKTLSEIAKKRAELDLLLGTRDTQHLTVLRERANLQSAVTTAAKGVPDAVKALNCTVATKSAAPVTSTEAPMHLVLKNSPATPGMITAKCKAVHGAASYLFVFTTDPNAQPGVGTTVAVTKARCEITGQTLGHVLYARVAVVRKGGGQSVFSDVAQILVR